MSAGKRWVVGIGSSSVNHGVLISRIALLVSDQRVLRLIRRYLQAGMMQGGLVSVRREGTSQGGLLSPLVSNTFQDEPDKEPERRGHACCRYADDNKTYVQSRRAGGRVMESITRFLERQLKLKVNREKSAVNRPWRRRSLSYSMTFHVRPRLKVAPESVKRLKGRVKELLRRGRGWSLKRTAGELAPPVRGWGDCFRFAQVKNVFEELDGRIRRRL